MRILFLSPVFAPLRGGVETVVEQLSRELVKEKHEVVVSTETKEIAEEVFPFDVLRVPSGRELRRYFQWADIIWSHQLCFHQLGRAWRFPPRMGATFHTWLPAEGVTARIRRQLISRFSARYGVSEAISHHLPNPTGVLFNSYDPERFQLGPEGNYKRWDFGCVGRLVHDKGIDLFLKSLGLLKAQGIDCRGAIVGSGPEEKMLKALVEELKLSEHVEFIPWLYGDELVEFYQNCKVCVVPSRWKEPFGLVALEAIACGAVVVAANHGGLPEAVGSCGLYFEPENVDNLALQMKSLMIDDGWKAEAFGKERESHLSQFLPQKQIAGYLKAFTAVLK